MQLPSLRAVLLVSHRRPHVTLVVRIESGWDVRELRRGEELVLEKPSLRFTVAELYRGIQFEPVAD